ncbi:SDR family NAD(P)-dependent oxidoreductase [Bacillus sp. B4EP4a]|uniref:SDR family NAD(P)-dependent oxidoreductase n=1 Tax=Bacillus sp. B4EP4a TaxID=2590665 RepID=UPI002570A373|nr:SDR family NAD(P)-dependent oxidoreductase [Bacillus sp. B4EP4a]
MGVPLFVVTDAKKMVELNVNGTIVNTASINGTMAAFGSFNYNAAKAAVVMMSKSGALELAEHGIRVVGVAPGFIDSSILGDNEEVKNAPSCTAYAGKAHPAEASGQRSVDDGFLSFKSI